MTKIESKGGVEVYLELYILTHIVKDLSEVIIQNKDLAAELALTKKSVVYLYGKKNPSRISCTKRILQILV